MSCPLYVYMQNTIKNIYMYDVFFYLGSSAGESSDKMFLVKGDMKWGRQLAHTKQVLRQRSAQRQNPGVETRLIWKTAEHI